MKHQENVTVVGCGVSGLTSGIRLLEAGYAVDIIAREVSRETTSDVAAAFWYPFRAEPREKVIPWADRSYREFALLSEDESSGVSPIPVRHCYSTAAPEAWWTRSVEGFATLDSEQLPNGYTSGFTYKTYLSDTSRYMPYLRERFEDLGGKVTVREISTLDELIPAHGSIVNCTGVWAGKVASDSEVLPIRGQILRVRRPALMEMQALDGEGIYVVCRTEDCIIGGANEDGSWDREPRAADRAALLQRVERLCPELASPEILEEKVGLRPGRSTVRVETERRGSTTIVHNYGHGGAGFTLSWGCAEEVARLVSEAGR